MLQIASGKLFYNGVGRVNTLTGVIHTNLKTYLENPIETKAGSILGTSTLQALPALVYTFQEMMEETEERAGIIVSSGIEPYITDFCTILSFTLNCIATPDFDLLSRLTSGNRSYSVEVPPQKLLSGFFDKEVLFLTDRAEFFSDFVNHLIGLKREDFLNVMRAIRTYVTAMHRIADDVDVAYTLMVAALESLGQAYTKDKKLSLAKKFETFVLDNVTSDFFRREEPEIKILIARPDLQEGLKQSYCYRSAYIHSLEKLPRNLIYSSGTNEVLRIGNKTWLTLQGMSSLTRHVITEFVFKQEQVSTEPYEYAVERTGVITAPLSPEYWLGRLDNLDQNQGVSRLNGFLENLSCFYQQTGHKGIVDLKPLLEKVEKLLPQLSKKQRLPFLVLYAIFNYVLSRQDGNKNLEEIINRYSEEFSEPAVENLILCLIVNATPEWCIEKHTEMVDLYFKNRSHRNTIKLPRLFEAGLYLSLAKRFWDIQNTVETTHYLSCAVEAMPGHTKLREAEKIFMSTQEINLDWQELLLGY